jgi:hypothetical protein
VSDQPRNLFQWDAAVRQQRHEAVPKLSWRPVGSVHSRRVPDGCAERPADVRSVRFLADSRREDQAVFLPAVAGSEPVLALVFPVLPQCLYTPLGERESTARLLGLGVPVDRTDRHTAMYGGTDGTAVGSPFR